MKQQQLGSFSVSEIVYGMWRINESELRKERLIGFLKQLYQLGINTIDTAALYGGANHKAEQILGEAFAIEPTLRQQFTLITKCGIELRQGDLPHYDNTQAYILAQVENSLINLSTNRIDILLLHRPDLFIDFEEIYQTFSKLQREGKVTSFGVSNYTPVQFESLNRFLSKRGISLVTNQIELNNFTMEHYENDNTFYLKGEEISPMIWSPMAGGTLFNPKSETDISVTKTLTKIAQKYNATPSQIVISFLHAQGLNPVTILGSQKIDRYEEAIEGLKIKINQEEKYCLIKALTQKGIR